VVEAGVVERKCPCKRGDVAMPSEHMTQLTRVTMCRTCCLQLALREAFRVLKPGGRFMCLEFRSGVPVHALLWCLFLVFTHTSTHSMC